VSDLLTKSRNAYVIGGDVDRVKEAKKIAEEHADKRRDRKEKKAKGQEHDS